jgi:hypothetical protein
MSVFLDTSVLLAGLIDFGPQSAPAQSLLHAVAEKRTDQPATAWHCCLEFFSVATRLPPEFRIAPPDAAVLLQDEVFSRMAVHDLPATNRQTMLPHLRHPHRRNRPRRGRIGRGHRQSPSFSIGAPLRHPGGDPGGVSVGDQRERIAPAVSDEHLVTCPYCGEAVEIYIEPDVKGSFVQDCEVCCNPWRIRVTGRGENRDVQITRADGSE